MTSRKRRELTSAGVSRETLEETPNRALTFLMGVAMLPTVRSLLSARGYDVSEHKRGWALLEAAANRDVSDETTDEEVSAAVAALDNWDEPNIRLIRAAFTRHPEARASVLAGIKPVTGAAAVVNVSTILDRLDALESTKEGALALATLARRGLDGAERKRVAALLKTAKSGKVHTGASDARAEADDGEYEQSLLELREWFEEWSEIARLNVRRRDHLIRLGLAERRSSNSSDEVADPAPFVTDPARPDKS